MAEERIGDPARGLDPQHENGVGMGKLLDHLPERFALRQLVDMGNGVHLQRQGVLKAIRQRLLLLPGVETLVNALWLVGIAQAFLASSRLR